MAVLYQVGNVPHKVDVVTRPGKGDRLWLRWRRDGNWRHESLKARVGEMGAAEYERHAHEKLARLLNQLPEAERPKTAPLTIRQGLALVTDAERGLYPVDTGHRREVVREVERVAVILEDKPWAAITDDDLVALWRRRIRTLTTGGHRGYRGAEVTMDRLLAVAAWLRRRKHIPAGACVPPADWEEQMARDWRTLTKAPGDYAPEQPRYTLEEHRALIRVAPDVDPRFGLMLALGAELRLGQVARARRSWLDLEANTFRVPSMGGKKGTTEVLTPAQRAAVDGALEGYCRTNELRWRHDAVDYVLFPGRRFLRGQALYAEAKPITRAQWRRWLRAAEDKAEITHLDGRGGRGMRRAGVDGAKAQKISREALKNFGGWISTEVADTVYADQEAQYAAQEAAKVRAQIRGEETPRTPQERPETYPPRNPARVRQKAEDA